MLMLFKPWSNPRDLISGIHALNIEDALKTAFENMTQEFPKIRMLLTNMQALHECKDSCDDHFLACQSSHKNNVGHQQHNREDICNDFMFGNPDEIGDEILEHLNQIECLWSNAVNSSLSDAMACVHAAEEGGMFQTNQENPMAVDNDSAHHLETSNQTLEELWANEYEQCKADW